MAAYSVQAFIANRMQSVAETADRTKAVTASQLAAATSGKTHRVYMTGKDGKRKLVWTADPEESAAALRRKGIANPGAKTLPQWLQAVNTVCTRYRAKQGTCSRSNEPEVLAARDVIRETPAADRAAFGRQQRAMRRNGKNSAENLIGQTVDIKRNHPYYAGHWGKIVAFDGRYFHISGGSIGASAPAFSRDEFTTKKKASPKKATRTTYAKKANGRKAAAAGRRRNSEATAAEVFEEFHGEPSRKTTTLTEQIVYPSELADLGALISLVVAPLDADTEPGARVKGLEIKLRGKGIRAAATPDRKEIIFAGGDQQIDLSAFDADNGKGQIVLGQCLEITYKTTKGFHNFEPIEYYHEFGEETGERPLLAYDTRSQRLYLLGGKYFIAPEGIRN